VPRERILAQNGKGEWNDPINAFQSLLLDLSHLDPHFLIFALYLRAVDDLPLLIRNVQTGSVILPHTFMSDPQFEGVFGGSLDPADIRDNLHVYFIVLHKTRLKI